MMSKLHLILFIAMFIAGGWIMPAGGGPARAQAANDARRQTQAQSPATVVIDDSALWGQLPLKDQVADATSLKVSWLFNNTALMLLSQASMETEIRIPEAGTYYLYARSKGARGSSFRVALDKKVSPSIAGGDTFSWQRIEKFDLPEGPIKLRITRIFTAPALDVLVLTKKENFTEEELRPLQLDGEVRLLKEYRLPRPLSVNFGDANNDGKLDLIVMSEGFSAHIIDHDGKELWAYKAPPEGAEVRNVDDINGVIWDLEADGHSEVLHWRHMEGGEWLVVADGKTGKVENRTKWPAPPLPHPYWNTRIAIARFSPGHPNHIVVFSDTGGTISLSAYTKDLQPLWTHTEKKQKDHLGHYTYPFDINGDGIDEIVASAIVLDASGKVVWNRFDLFDDNHDHADQIRFVDLNGDGRLEMVAPWSDVGVVALDALSGDLLWWHQAEHTQRLQVGNFLSGVPGPHLAASARFYGNRQFEPYLWAQVHWFDAKGKLLSKWPANPLNCNPVFVKGDWRGDGGEELFWHLFKMTKTGAGVLYFSEPVYHMFDFMGDRAEEVITMQDDRLRVYGYRRTDHSRERVKRDLEYWRTRLANHDH